MLGLLPSGAGAGVRFFKGTCTRGIYDNMKTAVETTVLPQLL